MENARRFQIVCTPYCVRVYSERIDEKLPCIPGKRDHYISNPKVTDKWPSHVCLDYSVVVETTGSIVWKVTRAACVASFHISIWLWLKEKGPDVSPWHPPR